MADYYPLLSRTIANLPHATPEIRQAIYDRARQALIGQLRNSDPPAPEETIASEIAALEAAAQRVEAERQSPTQKETSQATPSPAKTASPEAPPSDALETAPPASPPNAARETMFPAAPPTRPAAPIIKPPPSRFAPPPAVAPESPAKAQPPAAVEPPSAPETAAKATPANDDAIAARTATRTATETLTETPASERDAPVVAPAQREPQSEASAQQTPAPPAVPPLPPASRSPAASPPRPPSPPVPPQPRDPAPSNRPTAAHISAIQDIKAKSRLPLLLSMLGVFVVAAAVLGYYSWKWRLLPDAFLTTTIIPAKPGAGAGKPASTPSPGKVAGRASAPDNAAPPEPKPATPSPAQTATVSPPPPAQKPAEQGIAIAQRAAFLIQDPTPDNNNAVKTYTGSVVWKSQSSSRGSGQPLSFGLRADVSIPEASSPR